MIDPPAPNRWTHSCLSDRVGLSLSEVHLNDRQKLSVLLQATCLESFLRELGQRVVGGWVGLTVDSEGLICGARTEPGISGETAQIWLSQLCERLFRTEGAPPGPGKARVGARRLLGYWAGFPTPMRPARAAGDLLDLVPELWSKKFATIRASLAGEIAYLERTDLWVVGNGSFKKQALSVADTYKDLCRWLASDGAREAWARSRSQYQRQAELTPSRRRSGTLSPIEIDEVSTPCFRPWSRARRSLGKQEAAAAWKRIALQRIGIRDLVGADRAICHALRLLGPAADMPVLLELQTLHIDFRIRRGFLADLSEILRRIEQAALRCDDPDIRFRFEILRSRFELNRGMPATALENLERSKSTTTGSSRDRSQALVVLQARCLGLLGQGDECRSLIDAFGPSHWRELEPEEQSAVWAQAGDLDAALSSSHGRPWERLWRQVADGGPIEEKDIRELKVLGEYRQARLVLDLEMVGRGLVPARSLSIAEATFRRLGAGAFAARLDRSRRGSWGVLTRYLERGARRDDGAVRELFERAGYFDSRLSWSDPHEHRVLVPGIGGALELREELANGHLLLRADRIDLPLRALFAIAARDYWPSTTSVGRPLHGVRGLVGESQPLCESLMRLDRLSRGELTILIQGETGTGKEIAARQAHRLSGRSGGPFVAVNCAALSESLLQSELFGHARGAFTGADRARMGIFESAGGGTVFLDEIGDLPSPAQAKLLRVLQEGEVRRLGESRSRTVDVRVVVATHRDLRAMTKKGEFRSDLFYRLAVGRIELPALRHRGRDVILLADHFLGDQGYSMTPAAAQRLLRYHWPGNVRELKNTIELAMVLCDEKVVDVEHLELPSTDTEEPIGYHRQVEDFRRSLVSEALRASEGRKAEAARRLNLSRQALSYLAKTLGVG